MPSFVPRELLHKIAKCLPSSDLQKFRLTSCELGDIGLEYLIPEVHLILTVQSFDRLKQISLHPRLSKYIYSIFYECDPLRVYSDMSEWTRAHGMVSRNKYSVAEIGLDWQKYREVFRKQEEILVDDSDKREVREALLRLPRLTSIRISNDSGLCPWTPYLLRSFKGDSFQVPVFGTAVEQPAGIRQISSIFEVLVGWPACFRHLRTLNIGTMNWEIFLDTNASWWENDVFALLEEVKVILSVCSGDRDPNGNYDESCREHLERESTLVKFLSPMRHLNKLDISFDDMTNDCPTLDADYAIGVDITWPELREITIGNLRFGEDNLISFLGRHVQSLTALAIKGLMLDEDDEWDRTLCRIRDLRSWEKVAIRGSLFIDQFGGGEEWVIVEREVQGRDSEYIEGTEEPSRTVCATKMDDFMLGRSQESPLRPLPYH